ncbi:MAG: radical SAM protein [Syntrophobacteraceae bacterium]
MSDGLLLNPDVKLRPDGGRAVLFSIQRPESRFRDIFRFLFPQQAVVLSLFDGRRDLSAVSSDVAYLFSLNETESLKVVEAVLDVEVDRKTRVRDLLVNASAIDAKSARLYDPLDFIVPADQIDMADVRCRKPTSLLILPTLRCYAACRYCYADRGRADAREEFGLDVFEKLLDAMEDCGMETAEFSGGDFFCRKDAYEVLECILARGMHANIPTKYPLDRDQVRRLARLGLTSIQISVDALEPGTVDYLVGVRGYAPQIFDTIDLLGEFGIKVRTNTVITAHNDKDCIRLARYLLKLPHVIRTNFTFYARSIYQHDDGLFCPADALERVSADLDQLKTEYPEKEIIFSGVVPDPNALSTEEKETSFWERAFCTANRRSFAVLPDGKVTICEEFYYHPHFLVGDLKRQDLLDIWNSPRCLDLAYPSRDGVPDGECRTCPDFNRCHHALGRCPREAVKAYGPERHHWPDPRCPRAPRGRRLS